MNRHIRDKHVGGSNRCTNCRQCFLSAFNLERHTKICLDKERYCCKTCGKKFKACKEYKLHQYDHLGYRPFNCPEMSADGVICDYSSKKKATSVQLFSNICECLAKKISPLLSDSFFTYTNSMTSSTKKPYMVRKKIWTWLDKCLRKRQIIDCENAHTIVISVTSRFKRTQAFITISKHYFLTETKKKQPFFSGNSI
jgi:hypothetical protein